VNTGTRLADELESWAIAHDVAVKRPKDSIRLKVRGQELFYGRETQDWLFGVFRDVSGSDEAELMAGLGGDAWDGWLDTRRYWRGRITSREGLSAVQAWVERHST
jgi:hypothetical protein